MSLLSVSVDEEESFDEIHTLQVTCVVVGNVIELGILVVPVEKRWTIAEAVLHLQRFVVFHVVHQIEIAHLIIVGGPVSEGRESF